MMAWVVGHGSGPIRKYSSIMSLLTATRARAGTENAFATSISGAQSTGSFEAQRSYLRYNQVVGSIRLETVRVGDSSCEWQKKNWITELLASKRPKYWGAVQLSPYCCAP